MIPGSPPKRRLPEAIVQEHDLRAGCIFLRHERCVRASAVTPNKSKRLAETRRPSRRSGSPTPVRLKLRSANAAMPSKTCSASPIEKVGRATACSSGTRGESRFPRSPRVGRDSCKAAVARRRVLTTLKMALFAPMPRASASTAIDRESRVLQTACASRNASPATDLPSIFVFPFGSHPIGFCGTPALDALSAPAPEARSSFSSFSGRLVRFFFARSATEGLFVLILEMLR